MKAITGLRYFLDLKTDASGQAFISGQVCADFSDLTCEAFTAEGPSVDAVLEILRPKFEAGWRGLS
jgi:hypothetical protein